MDENTNKTVTVFYLLRMKSLQDTKNACGLIEPLIQGKWTRKNAVEMLLLMPQEGSSFSILFSLNISLLNT